MSLIKYKNKVFYSEDEKFDLNDILKILNYDFSTESMILSKEQIINILSKKNNNEVKEFITFLKNNEFEEIELNIFDFMYKKKIYVNSNKIFNKLWKILKFNKILIDDELLEYMGFTKKLYHDNNITKENYLIDYLENKNIDYEKISLKQLNYQNNKILKYKEIEKYIKDYKNINQDKIWIILNINNFKECVMCLEDEYFIDLKKDYIQIENIFKLYNDYIFNFKIKQQEKLLIKKENKIKFLEEKLLEKKK